MMTPERYRQIGELYHAALEVEAEQRAAFLDQVCAGDEALRGEVESLIASHEQASGFIAAPALAVAAELLAKSEADALIGQTVARYRIHSLLGAGGMGRVYLALDTELGRHVALKFLPEYFTHDKNQVQRFRQEARAVSALNHPNILTVYEVGQLNGSEFIATEYVEGETLRARLKENPFSLPEALRVVTQIADALVAAHEAGIVHRDIKPENVMLRRDGIVKVMDFGLAKLSRTPTEEDAAEKEGATRLMVNTTPGVVMGTVGYMSPEQAQGKAVDLRSDIFSFGCVLFEAATGHKLFEGDSTIDSLHKTVHAPAPPIRDFNPAAPPELERIVRRCLAKEPERRYQSIKDVAIELDELRQELKSSAQDSLTPRSSTPALESAPRSTTSNSPAASTADAARRMSSAEYLVGKIGGHRVLVFAVLALFGLAAVGLAVYKFSAATPVVAKHFTSPQKLNIARLTSSGKVTDIAMSPDGKYVAYVIEDAGKLNIRLRQTTTTSDIEIVAPDENQIKALSFKPDGVYLYYLKYVQNLGTLYQIPALGGQPKQIVVNADSGAAVSPDGKQLAFVRESDRSTMLIKANADGSNQKTLVQLQDEDFFWKYAVPSWSPDGKTIACGAHLHEKDGGHLKLIGVNANDGTWRLLNDRNWSLLSGIQWLPDNNLIVSGGEKSETSLGPVQLWLVAPNAAPQRLTNDLNFYFGASVTASGDALVTLQTTRLANLWVAPNNDATRAAQIAPASEIENGLAWTPDSRFIYCSNVDLWTMNADGTNQKQVLGNRGPSFYPQMTPDGHFIVFQLHRGGNSNIWRMDADGGNLKQLTNAKNEYKPGISPDGKWVIYLSAENSLQTLWKVSIDGGAPVQLTTTQSLEYAVSPRDGVVAYVFNDTNMTRRVSIIPPNGGAPIKMFGLPPTAIDVYRIRFTPDGRALAFLDSRGGGANVWTIALDGTGGAKPITDFKTEKIFDFAWSYDGKQLAVIRGSLISDAVLISEER